MFIRTLSFFLKLIGGASAVKEKIVHMHNSLARIVLPGRHGAPVCHTPAARFSNQHKPGN
jgi:hypothetical protein